MTRLVVMSAALVFVSCSKPERETCKWETRCFAGTGYVCDDERVVCVNSEGRMVAGDREVREPKAWAKADAGEVGARPFIYAGPEVGEGGTDCYLVCIDGEGSAYFGDPKNCTGYVFCGPRPNLPSRRGP